jgi:uncharacterized protein YicC (UPF0701 family)
MEYKLNKIEPEVRQRIKETTSAGKVHTKTGITINQDNKNKKNKDSSDFSSELEKHKNKKKISVDAVKVDEVEISVYKEGVENSDKDEIKGHILDVRK